MKLSLPNITPVFTQCTGDLDFFHRQLSVLNYCTTIIEFGGTSIISAPIYTTPDNILTPEFTYADANIMSPLILAMILARLKTGFIMAVSEDGFPIDPYQWMDGFMEFDFIGAPWPDGMVGNNGFCLMSRRFIEALVRLPPNVPGKFHDVWVGCEMRPVLENEFHVRFAPPEIAVKFSTENTCQDQPSFGFHGRKACRQKYLAGLNLVNMTTGSQYQPLP